MMPNEINVGFRENVKRTSTKTKLSALMTQSYRMTKVMKHEERLRLMFDKYKMLGYVARNIKKWEHFAFYIACLLNIIVLFSYSEYYVTKEQKLVKASYDKGRLYDPRLFYMKD